MRPNLSVNKLRAFKEVADRRSITEAARVLEISQPVASVHVRDVEQYFGTKLLYQDGRRMLLTETGELVYEHVNGMLAALEGAHDDVRSLDSGHAGSASIGATETPGSYRLPAKLIAFHLTHPKTQIVLHIGVASEVCDQTRNGLFDFSVVAGPAPPRDLQVATYSEERLVLVCSPEHRLAGRTVDKTDLVGQHLVTASRRSRTDDRLHTFGLENATVAIEMGSTEGLKLAVQRQLGIAVLFACSVEQELAAGTLAAVHVCGANEQRPFYLISHGRKRYSPLQQRLVDFLLTQETDVGPKPGAARLRMTRNGHVV
ncbi:MAG: LysR family transcriptional regulator [Acidimicrobiales bacterium]